MKVHTDIKWVAAIMPMMMLCFSVTAAVKGYRIYRETVDNMSLKDKMASTRVRENYTTFDQLPEIYVGTMLSVEDHGFYNHPGIDVIAIGRAVFSGIRAGAFVEGGDAVTQQLAKNMCFSQKKELVRKMAEVLAASDLERNYNKNEVLGLYVDTTYYGNGYYCVRDASNGYFDKEPEDMMDYKSVLLAGTPNAPSCRAPTVSQELTARRQQQVLNHLVECGYFIEERVLETMAVGSGR